MDEKEREALRLAERLRQIAESQRLDFDSPNVARTLDEAAAVLAVLPSRETPVEDARDVIATVKAHSTIAAGLTLTPNDVDALVLWINEHESRETVAPVLELPETPDGRKRIHWLRRDFIEDRPALFHVAPTEEQIARESFGLFGNRMFTWDKVDQDWWREKARAVLALFPGESREAVEAKAQTERTTAIVAWLRSYHYEYEARLVARQFGAPEV